MPKSRPESPQARPSENGANNGKSPQSPKSPAIPPQLKDTVEVFGQPYSGDRLLELYSGELDANQRSYHWLVLMPPQQSEEHFSEPMTRDELARKYPPPAVLIPFVTAADMASLWRPHAK